MTDSIDYTAGDAPVPEQAPLTLSSEIGREEFYRCNRLLLRARETKKRGRFTMFGIIELGIAAFMLYSILTALGRGEAVLWYSWAVFASALAVAAYTFCYYPLVYPAKIRRVSDRVYDESDRLHGVVTLRFYRDYLTETANSVEKKVDYEELSGIVKLGSYYLFSKPDQRAALFPAAALRDPEQFGALVDEIRNRYQVRYTRISD